MRTLPASSFVLQVPHCPCRQEKSMGTPCSSAASNNVWQLRIVHVLPDRANSTVTSVSTADESGFAIFGIVLPKLSCLIRFDFTPKSVRILRLAFMNGGGPQRKKSGDARSLM